MLKGVGETIEKMCNIGGRGGTTVRVLRFNLCKIITFDFLEKKFCYLIIIPRMNVSVVLRYQPCIEILDE